MMHFLKLRLIKFVRKSGRNVGGFREHKFMKHMFNTLVQPHLDYCSPLWSPPEGGPLEKLENILRTFTSKIPAVKEFNYWVPAALTPDCKPSNSLLFQVDWSRRHRLV